MPKDVIGDQATYLQENMEVMLSLFNGVAVGIQLPQRVTLEVVETEPAMKGQTASSSYKPAKLSNGARAMVPPHIQPGTRIVVMTRRRLLRGARQGLRLSSIHADFDHRGRKQTGRTRRSRRSWRRGDLDVQWPSTSVQLVPIEKKPDQAPRSP